MEQDAKCAAYNLWASLELFNAMTKDNHPDICTCQYLLTKAKADPNALDLLGRTTLHVAVLSDRWDLVRLLLQHGAIPPYEVCEIAAHLGHIDLLRLLLDAGTVTPPVARQDVLELIRYSNFMKTTSGGQPNLVADFLESDHIFRAYIESRYYAPEHMVRLRAAVERIMPRRYQSLPEPLMYVLAVAHIVENASLSFVLVSKCLKSFLKAGAPEKEAVMIQVLEVCGQAEWTEQTREPNALADTMVQIMHYILSLNDKDKEQELAKQVAQLPRKNDILFFLAKENRNGNADIFQFLLEKCNCDPNVRNAEGDSIVHILWDAYNRTIHYISFNWGSPIELLTNLRPAYRENPNAPEIQAIKIFTNHGIHPCLTDSKGRRIDQMLKEKFPEFYRNGQPKNLQCLAALKIKDERIDYKRYLPEKIHPFLSIH